MCIFCKIINGEILCYKIYEDNDFLAFLDISQATYGHTLVVPKKHFENLLEMDDETCSKLLKIVKDLSIKIQKATKCSGINILNNNGAVAGQSVNHVHFHIIPRYENDDLIIKVIDHQPTNEELKELQNKLQ